MKPLLYVTLLPLENYTVFYSEILELPDTLKVYEEDEYVIWRNRESDDITLHIGIYSDIAGINVYMEKVEI